jgi:hypothetical protein
MLVAPPVCALLHNNHNSALRHPGAPSSQAGQAAYGQYGHVHEGGMSGGQVFLAAAGRGGA